MRKVVRPEIRRVEGAKRLEVVVAAVFVKVVRMADSGAEDLGVALGGLENVGVEVFLEILDIWEVAS